MQVKSTFLSSHRFLSPLSKQYALWVTFFFIMIGMLATEKEIDVFQNHHFKAVN